jgi:hypothetical protein
VISLGLDLLKLEVLGFFCEEVLKEFGFGERSLSY